MWEKGLTCMSGGSVHVNIHNQEMLLKFASYMRNEASVNTVAEEKKRVIDMFIPDIEQVREI